MLNFIGTWFGYVGMCLVAPDATCRPFLAFLALGAAAAVALTLVLLAYKAAQERETAQVDERRRARSRELPTPPRLQPVVIDKKITARPIGHGHGRWHVAV